MNLSCYIIRRHVVTMNELVKLLTGSTLQFDFAPRLATLVRGEFLDAWPYLALRVALIVVCFEFHRSVSKQ
jgi:hypothetical protein